MSPLFDEIVIITEEYLGPASKRFISRQIAFHLQKDPSEITAQDIIILVDWMRVTLALLTEDHTTVDSFAERLLNLANERASVNP